MNILFLRGFNNYFNREVKKYSSLEDYQTNSTASINLSEINFNPNDGVVTELIIGNENQKENSLPLDWENIGTPDYCVCYDNESREEQGQTIIVPVIRSRWFILESERTRLGQYRLALKRDVVAEHFDVIKKSPCFIEKGMISDKKSSLLYNKESMSFNQIKQAEIPLKDATNSGWIVGYVSQNFPNAGQVIQDGISTTVLKEKDPTDYYTPEQLPFTLTTGKFGLINRFKMSIPLNYISKREIFTEYVGILGYTRGKVTVSNRFYNVLCNLNSSKTVSSASTNFSNSTEYFTSPIYNAFDYSSNRDLWTIVEPYLHVYGKDYPYQINDFSSTYLYNPYNILYKNGYRPALTFNELNILVYPGSYNNRIDNYDDTPAQNRFTSLMNNYNWSLQNSRVQSICDGTINVLKSTYSYSNVLTSEDVLNYDGKTVKIGNNYYIMRFTHNDTSRFVIPASSDGSNPFTVYASDSGVLTSSAGSMYSSVTTLAASICSSIEGSFYASEVSSEIVKNDSISASYMEMNVEDYTLNLMPIQTELLHVADLAYTSRARTYDNYVDMFAIPYSDEFTFIHNNANITTKKHRSLGIARAIASRFGSGACYDLQYVPYCPLDFVRNAYKNGEIFSTSTLNTSLYQIFTVTDENQQTSNAGIIFWCSTSKGTFNIELTLAPDTYWKNNEEQSLKYSDILNNKINNEVQLCRLASPNFNGQFEFNLAKNNGVTEFNIDFTYKPYIPYIHVNPNFKNLYGSDWDDARGLICAGNFSLGFINDAWQNYQNQNKNYQQIFDRQIQNMDINNSIAMEKQQFQATTGTIMGGISGAIGGAMAGIANPITAVAGAVVGGLAGAGLSAYGAQKDINWLERQQQEAKTYSIDMYGYQLGNIQAIPYSINGTESLTNNNKIYPIIEIYEPTEEEIDILVSKIKYNGMTIMAIGKIEDYSYSDYFNKCFIKGQMIRLESKDINDDFHIVDAIYQEINKGIYIPLEIREDSAAEVVEEGGN